MIDPLSSARHYDPVNPPMKGEWVRVGSVARKKLVPKRRAVSVPAILAVLCLAGAFVVVPVIGQSGKKPTKAGGVPRYEKVPEASSSSSANATPVKPAPVPEKPQTGGSSEGREDEGRQPTARPERNRTRPNRPAAPNGSRDVATAPATPSAQPHKPEPPKVGLPGLPSTPGN